jgi:two-component system LytT family response regulator
MIKALIVDNEKNSIDSLTLLINDYCSDIEIIGSAQTVKEAYSIIQTKHPDLIFLDVEMDGETGFDLLGLFKQPEFQVIFQSAHEKYALKAIKSSCLEYMLKPIHPNDLKNAIEKFNVFQKLQSHQKRFEILMENMHSTHSITKIAIPNNDGYVFLNVPEIIYCQSDNNYTLIFTSRGERVMSSKSLKEFEELFPADSFFRCHKSWFINLQHIQKYSRTDGSKVMMTNGVWIDISVRKREEFLKLFDKF